MDEIRQILSEVLKLLATPEFQTQLEKSRQSSANDAVALLQSVRFSNYRWVGIKLLRYFKDISFSTLFGNIKGITPLVEMLNFWLSILNLEIERDGGKSVLRDKG